jgi:hypothetical protein
MSATIDMNVTRRINDPRKFNAPELSTLVKALELKDWYTDIIVNFGASIDGCTVAEFDTLLHPGGYQLGRVHVSEAA